MARLLSHGCRALGGSRVASDSLARSPRLLPSSRALATAGSPAHRLRRLLNQPGIHIMPCVYDGLSARVCEQAGFNITFVSGFSVSAVHGLPDTGLLSFAEMEASMARVRELLPLLAALASLHPLPSPLLDHIICALLFSRKKWQCTACAFPACNTALRVSCVEGEQLPQGHPVHRRR